MATHSGYFDPITPGRSLNNVIGASSRSAMTVLPGKMATEELAISCSIWLRHQNILRRNPHDATVAPGRDRIACLLVANQRLAHGARDCSLDEFRIAHALAKRVT
jgi:hypothetical protein